MNAERESAMSTETAPQHNKNKTAAPAAWTDDQVHALLAVVDKLEPRSNADWAAVAKQLGGTVVRKAQECKTRFLLVADAGFVPRSAAMTEAHQMAMRVKEKIAGDDSDDDDDFDLGTRAHSSSAPRRPAQAAGSRTTRV